VPSKSKKLLFSALTILLILVVLFTLFFVYPAWLSGAKNDQKPFYVGVTFGGNSSADAKQLIDKVKDYTNLFVVQSGPLQENITALEETCDYAVKSGLDVIVYFSSLFIASNTTVNFVNTAQQHWGNHFLGVYYGDEPGGRMLDLGMPLYDAATGTYVTKQPGYYSADANNVSYTVYPDSEQITLRIDDNNGTAYFATYLPNGTISYYATSDYQTLYYHPDGTVEDTNGKPVTDARTIPQFVPYQQLWDSRPIKNYTDAAHYYIVSQQSILGSFRNQSSAKLFTSDYALHWWDYQGGYDTVFAELGWNYTAAKEIGLVRGAANLQGKTWGTIITWTYTRSPYLASGDQIYDEMRLSYECGAKYVIVFNYAEDASGPYGTLQPEHFEALERFWSEVVQNSTVVHGGIKGEAALVLPTGFGWGMRNPGDTIWGLWNATSTCQQIWTQLQNRLGEYGSHLDIVYDDPAYLAADKYANIYYWNQTT
jgi:hypothetical protein